jgi:hypothetical protein
MSAPIPSPEQPQRLQELELLTRSYARYSHSAGGLGSVLGGVLCLTSYLAGGLLPLSLSLRILLMCMPFLWLLAKGGLARFYYQRFGHVEEQETEAERRRQRRVVFLATVIALFIEVGVLVSVWPNWESLIPNGVEYMVLVLMVPVGAVFWMRTRLEFIVGTFLFCQAAVVCAGFTYPLPGMAHTFSFGLLSIVTLMFPIAALVMIRVGVMDHRRFHKIVTRMEELRAATAGNP